MKDVPIQVTLTICVAVVHAKSLSAVCVFVMCVCVLCSGCVWNGQCLCSSCHRPSHLVLCGAFVISPFFIPY